MSALSIKTEPDWTFKEHSGITFLFHCLSPTLDTATTEQIQSLAQETIDWSALVEMAQKHKVAPLLYKRISTVCPTAMPEPVQKELQLYCQNTAVRNLFTTAELSRLLSLMKSQGVDTLPYKGPILAQALYGRLDIRQFGDLDIIIQPQDMLSVEKLLMAEGYRPYFGKKTGSELASYMAAKNEHSYDFYHEQKKIFIEMHWRFWPVFFSSVNPRNIWHRRESIKLGGRLVSNLKIEDYLIVLCMHGSRHQWERLAWLCDIAMLLHTYPTLDWENAIATAKQWGAQRMLYLGLYLAHTWLGATLPVSVLQKVLSDSAVSDLAIQVDERLFKEGSQRFLAATRYQIQARERWQDKATCAQSLAQWMLRGFPSEHHSA